MRAIAYLFKNPVWLAVVVLLCMCCLCFASPFLEMAGFEILGNILNPVRVYQAKTAEYITLGDVNVLVCDNPICNLEFEDQVSFQLTKGQKYLEFSITNDAEDRLDEEFEITSFAYSNGASAACRYSPYPLIVGGQTSTVRCNYPKQVDRVCLTLEFPEVHTTLRGSKEIKTDICQNIDGGK